MPNDEGDALGVVVDVDGQAGRAHGRTYVGDVPDGDAHGGLGVLEVLA